MTQQPPYHDDDTPLNGTTGITVLDRRDDKNASTIEEEEYPQSTRREHCQGVSDDGDDADRSNSPKTDEEGAHAVLHYWDRRRNPAASSSSSSSSSPPHGGRSQTKLDALVSPTSPLPLLALSLSSSSLSSSTVSFLSSTVSPSSIPLDMRDDIETVGVAKLRRRSKKQEGKTRS